jgi:hypothetical protein
MSYQAVGKAVVITVSACPWLMNKTKAAQWMSLYDAGQACHQSPTTPLLCLQLLLPCRFGFNVSMPCRLAIVLPPHPAQGTAAAVAAQHQQAKQRQALCTTDAFSAVQLAAAVSGC